MHMTLIDPNDPLWKKALGVLAAIVLIPIVIIVNLVTFPFQKPSNLPAAYVADFLRAFIDGTSGPWDYDDFEFTNFADPKLESIRKRVCDLELPIKDEELPAWEELAEEAAALAKSDENTLQNRNESLSET